MALALAWVLLVGVLGGAIIFAVLDWDPERLRLGRTTTFVLPAAPADQSEPEQTAVEEAAAPAEPGPADIVPTGSPDTAEPDQPDVLADGEPAEEAAEPESPAVSPEPMADAKTTAEATPAAEAEPDSDTVALSEPKPEASAEPAPAVPAGDPRIVVVITGLGLDGAETASAIDILPARVSLSFSPYAEGLPSLMARARAKGHEVLLDLPMEPISFPRDDPGPRALLTGLEPRQSLNRLKWILGRSEGYAGLAVFMGSRFVTSAADLRPILSEIASRNLFLLDNRANKGSQVAALAGEAGLSHAAVDRMLDDGAPGPETLAARLVQAERLAVANGGSIVSARVSKMVINMIAAWSAGLEERGLALEPLGGLLDRRESR